MPGPVQIGTCCASADVRFLRHGIGDMGSDMGIAIALRAGPPLRFGSGFAANGPRAGAGTQVGHQLVRLEEIATCVSAAHVLARSMACHCNVNVLQSTSSVLQRSGLMQCCLCHLQSSSWRSAEQPAANSKETAPRQKQQQPSSPKQQPTQAGQPPAKQPQPQQPPEQEQPLSNGGLSAPPPPPEQQPEQQQPAQPEQQVMTGLSPAF